MRFEGEVGRSALLDRYRRKEYAKKSTENGYYTQVLDPFIKSVKRVGQTGRVLDLASGRGQIADYFRQSGLEVAQADLSRVALKRSKGARVQCFADMTPFRAGSFDAIHMKDALAHIEDLNGLFDEIKRLLVPGGKVLITSAISGRENHFSVFTRTSLLRITKDYVPFDTGDDYLKKVQLLSDTPRLIKIDPPYYHTNSPKTKRAAALRGFILNQESAWTSTRRSDWYSRGAERFVLQFEKGNS